MTAPTTQLEVLTDFTAGVLGPLLVHAEGPPALEVRESGTGPITGRLLEAAERDEPATIAVVWVDPVRSLTTIRRAADFEAVDPDEAATELQGFVDLVAALARRRRAVLLVRPMVLDDPGLGLVDLTRPGATGALVADLDARARTAAAGEPALHVLDALPWAIAAGPRPTSPRQWFATKVPYSTSLLREAATAIRSAVMTLTGRSRRVVIVDLDNTLWGGIVGEDGLEGLTLGGHHPDGEAFVAFQRELKRLTRVGVQLAVVSRNDEATALEVFDRHPEMVLRREDLAAWRIGWGDKAEAVAELLDGMRLGAESAVFIDDSANERGRVAEALPGVLVPDWPTSPARSVAALRELRCFDVVALSREDRERTASYVAERERTADREAAASLEGWLDSLGLVLDVRELDDVDLVRAAQLLNKTNQMNLATRRLSERELADFAARASVVCATVRVTDRYGDAGLTGLVSVEVEGTTARVVDLLVSCRVLGRGVEDAMLALAGRIAAGAGATELIAEFVPTPRNAPCRALLERSGGDRHGEVHRWTVAGAPEVPRHVRLAGTLGDDHRGSMA